MGSPVQSVHWVPLEHLREGVAVDVTINKQVNSWGHPLEKQIEETSEYEMSFENK